MTYQNDAMIEVEAEKRYPRNHTVADPFGATGEAESDPYGYDETARRAFIEGAKWALGADKPAPIHQHEKWQIRESASGGMYCAACGQDVPDTRGNA